MLTATRFKAEMRQRHAKYGGPNDHILVDLANTDVAVLMGPSGIGKNEQKSRLVRAANASGKLAVVELQSITSRSRRKEERGPGGVDPYKAHFNIRSERGQAQIIHLFESRQIVQGAIHPESGHLYATLHEDYVASPLGDQRVVNLADYMVRQYLELAKKEMFRSFLGIQLAAADTGQWLTMWANRGDGLGTLKEVQQRLCEADESTGLCISEEGVATDGLYFVAHDYGDELLPETGLTKTTGSILSIISQEAVHDNREGFAATQSMHTFISGMRQGVQIGAQLLQAAA